MTTWADEFNTYEDACRAYGVDTPEQCEAEAREIEEEYREYINGMIREYGPYISPRVELECPF